MNETSDGSTASYYELPPDAKELQDLISYRNMNAQDGEMFRTLYRKGRASHSDELRDARKIVFYAQAEVDRLEKPTAKPDQWITHISLYPPTNTKPEWMAILRVSSDIEKSWDITENANTAQEALAKGLATFTWATSKTGETT